MKNYLLEVWNPTYTQKLAVATHVIACKRTRRLLGAETLKATVPLDDPLAEHAVNGAILRLQADVTTPEPHALFRLSTFERVVDPSDFRTLELHARGLWMDFVEGIVRQETTADRPPIHEFGLDRVRAEDVLADFIVPGYEGYGAGGGWLNFEVGDIDAEVADRVVTLQFDRTTPLAALRMLEQAADCEAVFRLSGSSYLIDLVHRTGSQPPLTEIRYQKNLQGLRRIANDSDIVTRIRAWGEGGLTLGDARWTLRSVDGTPQRWRFDVPPAPPGWTPDMSSWSRLNPIFEDDAFVGWWFRVPGKDLYPITASDTDGWVELDVAGRAVLATGDVGFFTADGTRPADYIESPSALAQWGVRTAAPELTTWDDIPDASNLLADGYFDQWDGDDLPTRWISVPGTQTNIGDPLLWPVLSKETDRQFNRLGAAAVRVDAPAGGGIASFETVLPEADPRRPYTGFRAALTLISGQVQLGLWHSNGEIYPLQGTRVPPLVFGSYDEVYRLAHEDPLPPGNVQLRITAFAGPAEFIVDAGMVTLQAGKEVPALVAGAAAEVLWEGAATLLADRSHPRAEYEVSVADLHRIDPTLFPHERMSLGDAIRIVV